MNSERWGTSARFSKRERDRVGATGQYAAEIRLLFWMAQRSHARGIRVTIKTSAPLVCRKLGVELQVEVNMSRSAYLQNDNVNGGKPAVMRQVVNDTRGHVSELLSKSIHQGALDQDLSKEDRDRMLSFLRIYGALDEAGKYNGCDRAGYSTTAR